MSELLTTPLDRGVRVATNVHTAVRTHQGEQPDVGSLLKARGGHSDLVLVAVPAGQGVIVEHWLRKALGVDGTEA
jgi:hypothetical protein